MLAFNNIGSLGRLGNQMFEYATLRGIAAKHGYEWMIPPPENKGIENYSLHECFKLSPDRKEGIMDPCHYAQEPYFHFCEELYEKCPDGVSLHGFFQSWRYFHNVEDELRKDYTFHEGISEPCKEMMQELDGKEPIMLHVRRGDPNLTDPRGFKWSYTQCGAQHPVQPIDYYEKALSKFDSKQPVIVFSDSVEWVKEQEFFKPDRFMISEPEDKYADGSFTPYADLCLMSLCSHAIIANSSMSWWGAWLNGKPNKLVIAPDRWFASKDLDSRSVVPGEWIKI